MHLIRNKLVVDSCCKSLPCQRNEENARKVVNAEVSSDLYLAKTGALREINNIAAAISARLCYKS